ncbi:MAG: hypothetical protein E6K70_10495 [Planctomycetota bacterium]|nr:MAG: hypothetical protein E6K70_10495 [Planctomycetota bacterium]
MPILYHYTDEAGLNAILTSGFLNPSLASTSRNDVRYGDGQYLTDIEPDTMTAAQLSRDLIGHPFAGRRFTHYLAIEVAELQVVEGRACVFVIRNDQPLEISSRLVRSGAS